MDNYSEAYYLKNLLLRIYSCKVPFELLVIDKKPKTKAGVYIVDKQRIRIYSRWRYSTPLEKIAIHEYAHHIHCTEQEKCKYGERPHGKEFWEIYGALMSMAVQKGLYMEERVKDIAEALKK